MKVNYRRCLSILATALVVAVCASTLQPRLAWAGPWWYQPDFYPSGSTPNRTITVTPGIEYTSDDPCDVTYQITQSVEDMLADVTPYNFAWWEYTLNGTTVVAKESVAGKHEVKMVDGKPTLTVFNVDPGDLSEVHARLSGQISVVVEPAEGGTATITAPEAYPEEGWYPIYQGELSMEYVATPNPGYKLKNWEAVSPDTLRIDPDKTSETVRTTCISKFVIKATFELEEYKVTVTDDGNGTAQADKTSGLHYGDTVSLTATPSAGYTFDHWEVVDPKDVTIEGDTLTMPDSDVEVKAIFTKEPEPEPESELATFTIAFKGNGGKGSMDSLSVEEGDSIKLTANAFKRSGYTFVGWNTEKDGSGDAYDNKEKVTPEDDLTLYAQWEKNEGNPPAKQPAKPAPKQQVRRLPQTGDPSGVVSCLGAALAGATLLLAGRKVREH